MGEPSPHISVKVVTKTGIITTCVLNHVAKDIEWIGEVKNDLLSNMAPPIIQSCSTINFLILD
jgi:hypothetical protein